MRYTVYTDGAYSSATKTAGCSYLIISDKLYINSDSIKLERTANPTHAETIGVGLAAQYILKNLKLDETDIVEFHIDCASAIELYKSYAFNKNNPPVTRDVRIQINNIRKLAKVCTIRFTKVRGHKGNINPNTYVDRLSKLAIRG